MANSLPNCLDVRRRWRAGLCTSVLLATVWGCKAVEPSNLSKTIQPSNYRDWTPDLAILPYAKKQGDEITVHNIRNCTFVTEYDFVVDHFDRSYNLNDLETLDFIVVPFQGMEFMAHTMLSFGFANGDHVAVSSEVRLEKGEEYSPVLGAMRQYEIMYVLADERDVIRLRTRHRKADVYIYRTLANKEQIQALFVDVLARVNKLAKQPEFYDTFTNNCTTNIVNHVNHVSPNRVAYSLDVLLPGRSDRYAYNLGLIDTSLPFEEVKQRAKVTELAERYYDDVDFSAKIRR